MSFRVLVADSLAPEGLDAVAHVEALEVDNRKGIEREELLGCIHEYDALVVRSRTQVDAELLALGTRLKVVGRAGIGIDNIDLKSATQQGVIVMNTPDGNAVTTAEHTVSMMMAASRLIPQATASMKAGRWEKKKFMGRELSGKTLGVVGLGNIGRIVSDRAQGLKMKVVGYDPFFTAEAAQRIGVEFLPLEEVLSKADVLTVHTPLTEQTRGLVSDAQIERMKPGVLLINCARGGIYDEQALVRGLESGKVGAVALDVFVEEPPPADHPLLSHERVICTPHLGASTAEAQVNVAVAVLEQIADYATGEPARNGLNLPRLSQAELREVAPYLDLAQRLGSFVGQIGQGAFKKIEIVLHGEMADMNAAPIATAALSGALGNTLSSPVNPVNARLIAEQRGVEIVESTARTLGAGSLASGMTVRIESETVNTVSGTLFAQGEGRIVEINDIRLEAVPDGHMLLICNRDMPGAVGKIGTVLGRAGVNISRMQLGLGKEGGDALAVVNIDGAVPDSVLTELHGIEQVVSVDSVGLHV